jgi:hypothetical protein
MILADMITAMRMDVEDAVLSDSEWSRCVTKAVNDLSRIHPLQKVYDFVTSYSISTTFTTGTPVTTPVSLGHIYLSPNSVAVSTVAGVSKTEGVDYNINTVTGIITPLVGGTMVAGTTYNISYNMVKIGVDITSIVTTLMRIEQVEYPAGQIPQQFASYSRWGNYLTIESTSSSSQSTISEGKHIWVYYTAEHTPPTTIVGSYEEFLDEAIMMGAEGYALQMKADKLSPTVATALVTAQGFITTGSPLIDTLNKGGASVAPNYASYAQVQSAIATAYSAESTRLRAEALDKRAGFWGILRDKLQLKTPSVINAVTQGIR